MFIGFLVGPSMFVKMEHATTSKVSDKIPKELLKKLLKHEILCHHEI